jgi:hypothetical protein
MLILVVTITHCAKCNRVKFGCEQVPIITLVAFFRIACAFHHWLNDLYRLGLQWLQQNIHRWRLVKLFVNYFDCVLRVEICLRVLSLAFAIFISLRLCLCLCLFVSLTCLPTALTWIIFFTQYIKFYAKENSNFMHGKTKWEYNVRLENVWALTWWTIFVPYNTNL